MEKPFTKDELKHLKFMLIKRGYTSEEANKELDIMIDTVKKNHKIELLEKKLRKKEEKKRILP